MNEPYVAFYSRMQDVRFAPAQARLLGRFFRARWVSRLMECAPLVAILESEEPEYVCGGMKST